MTDADADPDASTEAGLERLVDREALRAFLRDKLGDVGPDAFAVERHQAGHSNETLFVTWGARDLVLRRPPPGDTADSAHDVLREARFMDAVAGAETDVPVPGIVATCDDYDVLGCDFFLMDRLAGDVVRDDEPARFAAPDQRRQIGETLVDTLVAVHGVDWHAVGLGEFGPGEGYLERQVGIWRTQMEEWLLPTTETEREVPGVRAVAEWLAETAPAVADEANEVNEASAHALVHGDYKLDNVMLGPGTPPEIVGVFDWEMATVGDPLADLGWLLLFWRDEKDAEADVPQSLTPRFTANEGYPTRRELVARYEERTGRTFVNERFYRALAAYKIATACEAMYARYLSGAADDPMYPGLAEGVPAMVERARRIIDGAEEL